MRTLDLFRPSVGAFAIGMARTALELTIDYAAERETFGKPLKDHQAVSHRARRHHRARRRPRGSLVHQAATAHDAGVGDPALAAMAKLLATEAAQEAVDAAVQFHGARGLEHGHPLEHLYREVRAPADLRGRLRDPARDHRPQDVRLRTMSRTVVVTGGAKGIGRAVVMRFAALGDEVVALGRDETALKRLGSDGIRTAVCDVTDEDAVTRIVRRDRGRRRARQQRRHGRERPVGADEPQLVARSLRRQRHRRVSLHAGGRARDAVAWSWRGRHRRVDERARRHPVHECVHRLQARGRRADPGGRRASSPERASGSTPSAQRLCAPT